MTTRDNMLKRLRDDDLYKESLAKAKDGSERQAMAALVEAFVGAFADAIDGIAAQVEGGALFTSGSLEG